MYLYTELWKLRPAWHGLSQEARKQWVDTLLDGLQKQLEAGVEVIGFIANDGDTTHSSGYDFMAVWKMPDKAAAVAFEQSVEESGLHTYYEQVNTRGVVMELDAVVAALCDP